ncbi:AraC family transcriptional regulator [Spirosoma areae]
MKPIIYKTLSSDENSFTVKEIKLPYFDTTWHFHEEFELVLITKSKGKRFIGTHISTFEDGDLALLGPRLPHLYRNDTNYFTNTCAQQEATSTVIHFSRFFLGDRFLSIPEMIPIRQLFERSKKGLDIKGETKVLITEKIKGLLMLNGLERVIHLLTILNIIANSRETQELSTSELSILNLEDTKKINKVYEYVLDNYKETITLKEIADLLNMSSSNFCHYFKVRTKKTFNSFLNEVRIGHACKLLYEDNLNIAQVSLECGYREISNFNRQFHRVKKVTPSNFKKQLLSKR